MSTDENKAVLHRLMQELEQGNLDILNEHPGLDEVRPMLMQLLDLRKTTTMQEQIAEMIAEGDWVAVRVIRTGGPFSEGVEEIAMCKIVDGKIVKQHSQGGPLARRA